MLKVYTVELTTGGGACPPQQDIAAESPEDAIAKFLSDGGGARIVLKRHDALKQSDALGDYEGWSFVTISISPTGWPDDDEPAQG